LLRAAIVVAVGLMVLGATPASAYGALDVRYAVVDTDDCRRLSGGLPVTDQGNGCFLGDPVDGTFFAEDAGGEAVKIELWQGGGLVSKVEFHPDGEKVWVYDTRNDGDTVYAQTQWGDFPRFPVGAPGTDAPVDIRVFDDSCPDGQQYVVRLYDALDADGWGTDAITSRVGRC
jgi:hypothetical protein